MTIKDKAIKEHSCHGAGCSIADLNEKFFATSQNRLRKQPELFRNLVDHEKVLKACPQ